MLERWRSWLFVRLIATAFEPLLLRRRGGAWRRRIFLLGRRRWRSMPQQSLTQDCDRLRWQVTLPRTSSSSCIAIVAVVLPSPLSPLSPCRIADALAFFEAEPRAEPQQIHRAESQPQPSLSQPQPSRSRARAEPQPSREACRSRVMCVVAVTRVVLFRFEAVAW